MIVAHQMIGGHLRQAREALAYGCLVAEIGVVSRIAARLDQRGILAAVVGLLRIVGLLS